MVKKWAASSGTQLEFSDSKGMTVLYTQPESTDLHISVSSGTQPNSSDLQMGSSSSNAIEAEIEVVPKYTSIETQVMPTMLSRGICFEVRISIIMHPETKAKPELVYSVTYCCPYQCHLHHYH